MNSEISEIAKATQEVAKTTRTGIEATEKLGAFVARIMGEPIEAATGILTDKLRYMRAERQLRLANRFENIIKERHLEDSSHIVPAKLAFPIIESASLEEDDELQDLWANLLASALDPDFDGTLRTAFIDILRQLEIIDVHILNIVHKNYLEQLLSIDIDEHATGSIGEFPVTRTHIMEQLDINLNSYTSSLDNLMRVRCLTSYVEEKLIKKSHNIEFLKNPYDRVSFQHGYYNVCLTTLGRDFIEACIPVKNG